MSAIRLAALPDIEERRDEPVIVRVVGGSVAEVIERKKAKEKAISDLDKFKKDLIKNLFLKLHYIHLKLKFLSYHNCFQQDAQE